MSKVFQYTKKYIILVLCAVVLLFIQAWCDLSLPDYQADITNKGVIPGDISFIIQSGGKMLLLTLLSVVVSVLVGYCAAMVAANVSRDMRRDIFNKVLSFSNAEMDKFSTASLITRTTNDIAQVQMLLVMAIRMIFYAPIMGIGGVIKAVSKSTSLTGVVGIAVLVLICFIVVMFIVAMPKFQAVQKLIDRLNLVTRENLEGMLVIRAFDTEKFEAKRFDKANKDLTETNLFVNRAMATMMPLVTLVMYITSTMVIWVGARQVSNFHLDVGTMGAYMQYGMQIIMAFMMLSIMFILIPRAAVSANRVQEVLETEGTILDPEQPDSFSQDFAPHVEFREVSFRYPGGDNNVLNDLSFKARKGEITAIIGSTGSGKSTLINLLVRFYDVTQGQILIDGKDIRTLKLKDLRDKIGYVSQKSILFSGTIESNLRYSDKNASWETLETAARISQAAEFIASKEDGYSTPIAQGGTNVSGGQKQRLAIARAIAKNAPIYIFDDSFSALDLKTDRNLRAALKQEISHSTIFLVAQRISTIMEAEQIIVLDNGRIVGLGRHEDLIQNCEIYKEIAMSQLSEEELAK